MKRKIKKLLAPLEDIQILETTWLIIKYVRAKKSNKNLPGLRQILSKSIEIFTNRLKIVRKDNSFAGEHQILVETMKSLKIDNGYLVDIGAADGIRQSSTVGFLNNCQWEGTLFEYSPQPFSRLAFLYNDSHRVNLAKTKVTPSNVVSLFEGFSIPKKIDYLNIDIDSYDLSVIRKLIDSGYRPKIVSMEINEKFPPGIYFEVLYSEDHAWNGDHFFGCSLTAAYETLGNLEYSLEYMEYNNAIFVDSRLLKNKKKTTDIEFLYFNGYRNKPDRKELFPWNENIEILQTVKSQEAYEFILSLFSEYTGKFKLEIRHKF